VCSSFFDDPRLFSPGSAAIDCAAPTTVSADRPH
jgi:hypothetical protein